MEQFFVVQITREKGSEAFAMLITPKADETEAEMLWHQILSSVMASDNIEYANVYVEDAYGNKRWSRTIIPETEPNQE